MTMPEASARLREALVEVYPRHVRERVTATRPVPGLDEAIGRGAGWLDEALDELLSRPFSDQPRGPLEVFQEAMRFPTEALTDAGVEPASRDPVTENALPGDVYDLAPASTRDLPEWVWTIHLEWGATKAAAITSGEEPGPGGPGTR